MTYPTLSPPTYREAAPRAVAPPSAQAHKTPAGSATAASRTQRGASFASRLASLRDTGSAPAAGREGGAQLPWTVGASGHAAAGRATAPGGGALRAAAERVEGGEPEGGATPASEDPPSEPPSADALPFRPLPACVFAPTGRPAPALAPPPADVSRLAGELLRSLQVGGERGRGKVRLVLDAPEGDDGLAITLDETPHGVVATLHVDAARGATPLVRAIERELRRRAIDVELVEDG